MSLFPKKNAQPHDRSLRGVLFKSTFWGSKIENVEGKHGGKYNWTILENYSKN